jgi:tetratricopeptide (TPR) repeat protein
MKRYGINWGKSENDLKEQDYETIFTETSKIIEGKILSNKNELAIAFYNRGVWYSKKGLYQEAIADYTASIKVKNDASEVYYNRGASYCELNMYEKALLDFKMAFKLNPNDIDTKQAIEAVEKYLSIP